MLQCRHWQSDGRAKWGKLHEHFESSRGMKVGDGQNSSSCSQQQMEDNARVGR